MNADEKATQLGLTGFDDNEIVWSMTEPETVFTFSKQPMVWNFTNEHIID